jgi:hypothetical protein
MRRNERSGIGYIVVVVGLALFAAGLFWALRPAVCNNQAMYPGDRCVIYSGTSVSTLNYEQEVRSQRTTAAVLMVLGPAAVVGGIVILRRNRRTRR